MKVVPSGPLFHGPINIILVFFISTIFLRYHSNLTVGKNWRGGSRWLVSFSIHLSAQLQKGRSTPPGAV